MYRRKSCQDMPIELDNPRESKKGIDMNDQMDQKPVDTESKGVVTGHPVELTVEPAKETKPAEGEVNKETPAQ